MSDSPPSCPFCASTHTVERHRFLSPPDVATRFRVMRCARCDHQFTTPLPESALLERIYASQAHTEFQTRNDHLEGRRAVDDSRWAWLARRATPGVVVDVGCGSGLFLSRTPSDEWQPVGVEPEKTLADFAREHHGITMAANLDEALQDREPPSLITLWDVLEHMLDPRGEVERFRDALAPGGMLAIGAPNVRSLCARAFGAHWWGWSVPAHLHHFSSDTLRALLTDAGLEVVEIRFANYGFYLAASWGPDDGRRHVAGGNLRGRTVVARPRAPAPRATHAPRGGVAPAPDAPPHRHPHRPRTRRGPTRLCRRAGAETGIAKSIVRTKPDRPRHGHARRRLAGRGRPARRESPPPPRPRRVSPARRSTRPPPPRASTGMSTDRAASARASTPCTSTSPSFEGVGQTGLKVA